MIRRLLQLISVCCLLYAFSAVCFAQEQGQSPVSPAATQTTSSTVPRLVSFSGVLKDAAGKPVTGPVSVTFSLYSEQEGGTPLWSEMQAVESDSQGNYSVHLGVSNPAGLQLDLFTSGAARWLAVQPEASGAVEAPRVLLVGVPYALKAADADTLGGKPASAFVMAERPAESASTNLSAATPASAVSPATTLTGGGTTDYIPLWTSSTNLGNSLLYQGSGYVKDFGIFELPATGTATASKGYSSEPFYEFASAYNSSTSAAVVERFSWQVEPVGNNTASPSGTLNLLFASGTGAPAETGFSISSNGNLNLTGSINSALTLQGSVIDPNTGVISANVIAGFSGNTVSNGATGATIAGGGLPGYGNSVTRDFGTVGGGYQNTANGSGSIVAGGYQNNAAAGLSTVPGGLDNYAGGEYSFAAGDSAYASDFGSFVWCQQNGNYCYSNGPNSFVVSVDGPIYFYDGSGGQGCYLSAGSGSFTCSSDRDLKNNIVSIDTRSVLERVAQMPISQWSMKADAAGHKHIGPIAQDFYAAFGLGDTDKYIAQGDAQGVALASIQGLYQVVQEKDEQIRALVAQKDDQIRTLREEKSEEIQALRAELHALEERIERK